MIKWEVYRKGELIKQEKEERISDKETDNEFSVLKRIFDDYIKALNVTEFMVYLNDGVEIFFESSKGAYEIYDICFNRVVRMCT